MPVETGEVVVYKYVCDLFFTRGEAGYQDYADNCTTPQEGISFSLADGDENVVDQGSTGPDGTVTLSAAAAGPHSIVEQELSGYITLAVYCTTDLNTHRSPLRATHR